MEGKEEGRGKRKEGRKRKEGNKEGRGAGGREEERKKERKRKIQVRRSGCSANPWRAGWIFRKGKPNHEDSENGVRSCISSQVLSVNKPPGKWRLLCEQTAPTILLQA